MNENNDVSFVKILQLFVSNCIHYLYTIEKLYVSNYKIKMCVSRSLKNKQTDFGIKFINITYSVWSTYHIVTGD